MRRNPMWLMLAIGIVIGHERGRVAEYETWQKTLILWGCAAYEARSGQWEIIQGATCRPLWLEASEPEGD